uniref:5'-(N(7)-methylguanosine 5'-triphospho)-[mRNA] hydrolase n=1 Tax=Tetraodon nigroviridis TaxID=99883 RepID=H3C7Z3_TETNG
METLNAGHMMSLAALQRQDPYINKLLDVTGQVALYNFNSKTNEWEKTEIEGTLFVYARSASPHHGFTIMNRLSTENLVEPINRDLEFQLQDPFLLYRKGNLGIYSIWFYDKRDCQRIAQLMVRIVKQEAGHAQRGSPERAERPRTNGLAEPRPVDILELLSKAKEEYQRAQAGETDVRAEVGMAAPVTMAEHAHNQPRPDKPLLSAPQSAHTMVKQITVEELFGSPLPKDPCLPTMPTPKSAAAPGDPSAAFLQNQPFPAPAHQSTLLPPLLAAQDPASNQRHQAAGLLSAPFVLHPSPVFQAVVPRSDPQLAGSPLMVPPAGSEPRAAPAASAAPSAAPAAYLGQDLLSTLKPAAPAVGPDMHKPILAPSFLPSTLFPPHSFQEPVGGNPLLQHSKELDVFPPPSNVIKPLSDSSLAIVWSTMELPELRSRQAERGNLHRHHHRVTLRRVWLADSAHNNTPLEQEIQKTLQSQQAVPLQAVPQGPGLSVPRPGDAVLLSPSAFQQSLSRSPPLALPSAPSESSSSAGGAADPANAACSRAQLQETLIHLIKNDPDFLGAIHEAYLQSLSRDLSSMKL